MKGQLPTFQIIFLLVLSTRRRWSHCCSCCCSTQSFDDLYVHVTIIGFSGAAKCGEKGGSLFTRKVVKAGIRCQEKLLSS